VADLFHNVLRLHLKISKAKPRQGPTRGASAASEALGSEAEDGIIEPPFCLYTSHLCRPRRCSTIGTSVAQQP
jgi:hypothetical protein